MWLERPLVSLRQAVLDRGRHNLKSVGSTSVCFVTGKAYLGGAVAREGKPS